MFDGSAVAFNLISDPSIYFWISSSIVFATDFQSMPPLDLNEAYILYLQKLTDSKTQERYEKLKARMSKNSQNKPVVTEYDSQPKQKPKRAHKKVKKYNTGANLEVIKENNHFQSVNPTPIDDWD
mgnify:CR=1 FL=1